MISARRAIKYLLINVFFGVLLTSSFLSVADDSVGISQQLEQEIEQASKSDFDNDDIGQEDLDDHDIELFPEADFQDEATDDEHEQVAPAAGADLRTVQKRIKEVIVEGSTYVPIELILKSIPYRKGDIFTKQKTNKLIKNVYALGYFKPTIQVFIEDVDDDLVNLIVVVQEKKLLEGVTFKGNKHLSEKEIEKKVDFSKIPSIDEDDLSKYIKILKKAYRDKDYHDVTINAHLEGDQDKATLVFVIKEGRRTLVKRVCFTGNDHFRAKKLRSILFTREDWLLGFLDRAGSYQPEAIESDKQVIENYYQSNGFLNAKVVEVASEMDPETKGLLITFHVNEGDQYTISDIRVPGNEIISEDELLPQLPMQVGSLYSKDKIRETIEALRLLWGNFGYINADIEPSIQPDDDNKTVSLAFYTELGSKVYLNRINIIGNCKTYDKVIRRQLVVEEGCLLTTQAMDASKSRVESLGYFDPRDGVNWRMHRVDKDKVDLDLILNEVKTGRVEMQIGFGGSAHDITSPSESFSIGGSLSDTNLFGRGIHVNASASFSKEERNLLLNLTDPWLFDRPIHAGFDLYFKRSLYDEFKLIEQSEINERITGGAMSLGFISCKLYDATVSGKIGVDGITYGETPRVRRAALGPVESNELQAIFDRRFTSGAFLWFGGYAFKDIRNHPMHPSRGYQWSIYTKFAIHSTLKDNPKDRTRKMAELDTVRFGFAKLDLDGSWYTPLIGERDLVLCLHGHLGLVAPFKDRSIPFRELYHIGGPASVRGYLFGEIGPSYFSPTLRQTDVLGAKKAFWFNTELIFPIASDFSMKGAIFYDGGAGWDTPDAGLIDPSRLIRNSFDFRHSVGFGVRILRPTPIKVDWGFKLDRRKGESVHEVHFSMYQEF